MDFVQFRRKYPRYRVAHVEPLRIHSKEQYLFDQAVCLSKGGCGFYSLRPNPEVGESLKTKGHQRVTLSIEWLGESAQSAEVQANVLYERKTRVAGRDVYYYGLEFIPSHRNRLEPILEQLESWVMRGQLSTAHPLDDSKSL